MSDSLYTIGDLLRRGASESEPRPGIGWPKEQDPSEVDPYTVKDIHQHVRAAVASLQATGLPSIIEDSPAVVALFGPANIEWVVTFFAISDLGYTVFLVSPRLQAAALTALLKKADCSIIFYAISTAAVARTVQERRKIKLLPFTPLEKLHSTSSTVAHGTMHDPQHTDRTAVIWHSSGSTGLPKLFPMSHREVLGRVLLTTRVDFMTSAPYNSAGMTFLLYSLRNDTITYYWNESLPYTCDNLARFVERIKPQRIALNPYALKSLAETQRGIDTLKLCPSVSSFGSPCPKQLGDKLVQQQGVNLTCTYAMSEAGILMAYSRELGDTAWDYLAPLPHTEKYIWMKPVEDHHCECVVLEGALGCSISNSDDPPGSYHTKDLFVAHETMANRWRFVGRLDDRFPMANAENVLPLDIELNVAKEPLVKEAVVFGVGRPVLGILAFRSGTAKNMDDQEFVSAIWPSIEEMNSHTSATAQVSPQMVIPVAADSTYPQTDKRTFIRRRVYEEFELEIEQAYTRLEQGLGL